MARILALVLAATSVWGASYYRTKPEDAKAVTLAEFGAKGDGASDDSAGVQAAIDRVAERQGQGVVLVGPGRYRLTRTIYVWPGVRVIGYGETRPVFVLGARTAGYEKGIGTMFFFPGMRPMAGRGFRLAPPPPGTVPFNDKIADANSGTFYTALANFDIEIGEGNAGAVGVRFHAAQHAFLSHMKFEVGSGLAAVQDAGNVMDDLEIRGGRYGILTRKSSAAWQITLLDSTIEGQREAAIRENEAGLTMRNVTLRNAPVGIEIDEGYSDELYGREVRFEGISKAGVIISNEKSRMTQVNFEDVACRGVSVFAKFRESGRELKAPAPVYRVKKMSHGLTIGGLGAEGAVKTGYVTEVLTAMPAAAKAVIRSLPGTETWANVMKLGAVGDGKTDDTAALQRAIAEHKVLYFPMGHYVVRETLRLKKDTVLIGLHPNETQIDLLDGTPGFQGPGAAKAIIEAPQGGDNIVFGLGLHTGGRNMRAVGALWMAGEGSLMNDVRFLGGHGTRGPDGKQEQPYNVNLSGDPDPRRKWDSQWPSLWVTHGGGGTFVDIWTPSSFAQTGLYVSDTKTPGRVYEMSSEHHVRTEVKLDGVENWEFYALQTEGERGESEMASAMEIRRSKNLLFANLHSYRVVRGYRPFPYAIQITESSDIRFRNVHIDSNSSAPYCPETGPCKQYARSSKYSYGTAISDPVAGSEVRDREFAVLDVPGAAVKSVADARVTKLATGFYNLGGGAVDAKGRLYFVDGYWHKIYRWREDLKRAEVVRDNPLEPINLAFDKSGNLIVVSKGGEGMAVYAVKPDGPEEEVTLLERVATAERPGAAAVLPLTYWVNGDMTNTLDVERMRYATMEELFFRVIGTPRTYQYVSPDGSTFVPCDEVFVQGPWHLGYKWAYPLNTFGLAKAAADGTFYVTNESEQRTYKAKVKADGSLAEMKLFQEQGGEGVAWDGKGNVYLAAGQIYVFNAAGQRTGKIEVPERPLGLVFGGTDGKTLFILTGKSLYSTRVQ